jgi:two-component system, chemotaxis family, sensor kinase CheA
MDDLLREFVGETLEMMEAVAGDLVAWERDPADRSGIDRIFRTVHTVKGSSSFFDLPRITAVAHAAEELLDILRARRSAPRPETVAVVLAAFDRIRDLTQAVAAGDNVSETGGDDTVLIGQLLADVRQEGDPGHAAATDVNSAAIDAAPAHSPAPTDPDTPGGTPQEWRSVRIPVSLLDELMSGVSDLVLARNEVTAQLRWAGVDTASLPAYERLSSLLGSVRGAVGQMRMVPLRHLFAPLPRLIRQLNSELGKDVRLEIYGGEVEIDREVSESLRDPMVHALRNAIDHGIESSVDRLKAGKPAHGTLTIAARQAGNRIVISIDDDGRGLVLDKLVSRAIDSRCIGPDQADSLTDQRKADLIFLPGLSTAKSVTGISGRGVGMDVVKANVERLGGYVHVRNRAGTGLGIDFDVPMTLTIISALAISAGDQDFAIPRSIVEEVVLVTNDAVRRQNVGGAGLVRVRDRMLPLLQLESVIGLSAPLDEDDEDRAIILCRTASRQIIALEVPDVRDHEELVIKPLPPLLLALGLYSGMSLPDSGRPMLVLDVDGIARARIADDVKIEQCAAPAATLQDAAMAGWLTFSVGAGTTLSAVPMTSIGRIVDIDVARFETVGGMTIVNLDGELLPVLTGMMPLPDNGKCRIIELGDGHRSLLLPVGDIGEIVSLQSTLPSRSGSIPHIGLAVHDGHTVEMLDVLRLLSIHGSRHTDKSAGPQIWVVDSADNGWAANFLKPSLAAAGYLVTLVSDSSHADAMGDVILVADGDRAGTMPSLRVERGGVPLLETDGYDHATVIAALARGGGDPPPASRRAPAKGNAG